MFKYIAKRRKLLEIFNFFKTIVKVLYDLMGIFIAVRKGSGKKVQLDQVRKTFGAYDWMITKLGIILF
jgi:hypothetical protein